jgi:hypothetical protein
MKDWVYLPSFASVRFLGCEATPGILYAGGHLSIALLLFPPMLKKFDLDRHKKLMADLDLLGFRYPVTTIAQRMGMNKGNISAFLSGRIPLSQNFLDKFYSIYKEEIEQAAEKKKLEDEINPKQLPVYDSNGDRIEILENIENRLCEIVEILKVMIAR